MYKIYIMNNRLTPIQARRIIQSCLQTGDIYFRKHAVDQMFDRRIPSVKIMHVLGAGVVTGPEWENGEWRHRVSAGKIAVVVAIYDNVAVVTVMHTGR
jgi:hypothetical protein